MHLLAGRTIPVADLVGRDISAMTANVTAPGLRYLRHGGMVRRLIRAERGPQRDGGWLYLHWVPDSSQFLDCGYSGWRGDWDGVPTVEIVGGLEDERQQDLFAVGV